jgi:hypothetical protein
VVPAWSLLLALVAGAAAGWLLRSRIGRRQLGGPAPAVVEPVTAPAEPEQKMEAVLTELERRYQGRKAEPEPRPRRSRKA